MDEPSPLPIYCGNSMRSVFTNGEQLELEPVSFEMLREGDIVVIMGTSRQYVHRVIRITPESAVTMGDDNAMPDRMPLTSKSEFMRVRAAISSNGRSRVIPGGATGMLLFQRHQRWRRRRIFLGGIWCRLEPWAFWRIPARTQYRFGPDVCFYFRGMPIAHRSAKGRLKYFTPVKQLFFRVPEKLWKNKEI